MFRRLCPRLVNFTPVMMPALSPSMETGKILEWKKSVGDEIAPGDLWCRLETDKAAVDFNNTSEEGFLARIFAEVGEVVPVGQVIALLVDEAADVAKAGEYQPPTAAAQQAAPTEPPLPPPSQQEAPKGGRLTTPNVAASGPAVQRLLAQAEPDVVARLAPTGRAGRLTKADFLPVVSIDYETGRARAKPSAPKPTFEPTSAAAATAPAPAAAPAAAAATVAVKCGRVYDFTARDDVILRRLMAGGAARRAPAAPKIPA